MLRCDRGSENVKLSYLQPFLRWHGTDIHAGSKSFQYGRSVSNQVCQLEFEKKNQNDYYV